MSDLLGSRMGPYDLVEIVRRGGMATIYKAYQPSLDRYVAVKVMLPNRDPQFASRFKREARAVAQLQHPNIVQIYEHGEQDKYFYLAMQLIEQGRALGDIMGEPIPPVRALRLMVPTLAALGYAHARGVIHRDIKPANILLAGENWPMLIDFGIAKHLDDNLNLTMPGTAIGTPAYMAPEQAEGRPVDGRTDLYSLGVVLYEMVTGQVPFEADTPMAVLIKHVYDPPPPPRTVLPNIATSLERVMLRALAKDAGQRYQSATEMAVALEEVASELERKSATSAQTEQETNTMYAAGLKAFEEGRWDAAINYFQRVIVLNPRYEDATTLLRIAREQKERALAEEQAQKKSQPAPQVASSRTPAQSGSRAAGLDPMQTHRLPDVEPADYQRYGYAVPQQINAREVATAQEQPMQAPTWTGRETRPLARTETNRSVFSSPNALIYLGIGVAVLLALAIVVLGILFFR